MANTGDDKEFRVFELVTNIENELAVNSLFSEDKDTQKTIKTCVYYIILKAIAISKDPRADKRTAMTLYDLAKEIVINSQLDSDEATQNRLQDLINAIIDGDDLSAQLRLYNISNRQWLDSKTVILEERIGSVISDNKAILDSLNRVESKVSSTGIRRSPSLILMILAGFLVMLFTITLSVGIISTVLSTSNKDSFSAEDRMKLKHYQQYQNPQPNVEMK
jgi:hypothetical protein